ncbi:MAG: SDR family oxidoreductase [Methanomassiliicoccaceae archaeon]|nr:SDR family oxidoreductase [Euryarchaeota archaeon]HQA20885.1 SDR family oxidoreductase [Methanomassiliicoccaceae archaeon]HQD88069.1 SDR family oxidoreductase [Methanomassiliicoccaceae archaeon]
MNGTLRDNVILITGSSIGIGRATALRFSEEGSRIVITYHRDEEEAWEAAEECQRRGARGTMVLRLDLRDDVNIRKAVADTVGEMGHIDVLVNNAGVIERKPVEEQTFEDIEQQLRINLEGTIKMTRTCLPHLRKMVINVVSLTAHRGYPDLGVYAASKGGMISFSRTLAEEIGPRKVYNVFPGATATRMTGFHGDPPEKVAESIVLLARGEYLVPNGGDVKIGSPPAMRSGSMVQAEMAR